MYVMCVTLNGGMEQLASWVVMGLLHCDSLIFIMDIFKCLWTYPGKNHGTDFYREARTLFFMVSQQTRVLQSRYLQERTQHLLLLYSLFKSIK